MAPPKIKTLRTHWFMRGALIGFMFFSAINAASFFFRTEGMGSLLGGTPSGDAIGFPMELWRHGESYGGRFIDSFALAINGLITLVIATIFGFATLTQVGWLNRMVAEFEQSAENKQFQPFQFSIGNLMIATVPIAILFAAARTGRSEVLGAIYIFGPLSLIVLAMLPRGLSWDWRIIILTPMALSLIGFAIWIGVSLRMEFDKVLMGIFVCWVPQTVCATVLLLFYILASERPKFQTPISSETPAGQEV